MCSLLLQVGTSARHPVGTYSTSECLFAVLAARALERFYRPHDETQRQARAIGILYLDDESVDSISKANFEPEAAHFAPGPVGRCQPISASHGAD